MSGERVVVIGAGIGGLVSAALLAARGHDVTVLDAASAPGGKMRQVTVDGVAIDAGPTVFTLRDVFDDIFETCGASLDGHLTIRPAATLARHAWGDAQLDLFADADASEAAIGDFAGAANARGYRAFRKEARRIRDALDASFMRRSRTNPIGLGWRMGLAGFRDFATLHPYTSLWRTLGQYFPDPRLRQLFARYATYCGSSPFKAPATLMLVADVEARGVWLIDGGMHALARALEALAGRMGATFRYESPVREILVERRHTTGVMLASGERIEATSVVCNADPAALAAGQFGPDAARAVPTPNPRRASLSALVWLANAKTAGFPLVRHNVIFSPDYPAEFAALSAGSLADDPSVYVCAQDRGDSGGAAPEGRERLQIIVNAPPTRDGDNLSQGSIDQCRLRMLAALERAGLSLDLPPAAMHLTTPADFGALFPSTNGALYGPASHGWAASFLRPGSRTRIAGLYCAGGSTHPGAGVPMAALSGRLAVDCLLRDRASTSRSRRTAMPGGISTRSARTAATG